MCVSVDGYPLVDDPVFPAASVVIGEHGVTRVVPWQLHPAQRRKLSHPGKIGGLDGKQWSRSLPWICSSLRLRELHFIDRLQSLSLNPALCGLCTNGCGKHTSQASQWKFLLIWSPLLVSINVWNALPENCSDKSSRCVCVCLLCCLVRAQVCWQGSCTWWH